MNESATVRSQRILVTGAYGFIGQAIVRAFQHAGHTVVGCGRDLALGQRLLPSIEWVGADFNHDIRPEVWTPRLRNIDAVVNCVGSLQSSVRDGLDNIHHLAPKALFEACQAAGIRRVVQISALGIDGADTEYARTKRAGDRALTETDLDWVVLKPSLVLARGTFGGTALLRGLAAFPGIIPLFYGDRRFQPVTIDDLSKVVCRMVLPGAEAKVSFPVVGPEPIKTRDMATLYRAWLGLEEARVVNLPAWMAKLAVKFGDVVGWFGVQTAMRSTALKQMAQDNVAPVEPMIALSSVHPTKMETYLSSQPATTADRWHARLYFAKTALILALSLLWIWSGVLGLWPVGNRMGARMIEFNFGWPYDFSRIVVYLASVIDVVLGIALLVQWRLRLICAAQLVVSTVYLVSFTAMNVTYWFDPLGPLLKILPIMAATFVLFAIAEDR